KGASEGHSGHARLYWVEKAEQRMDSVERFSFFDLRSRLSDRLRRSDILGPIDRKRDVARAFGKAHLLRVAEAGEQNVQSGASLTLGVLVDRQGHRSIDQQAPRVLGELVADENDVADPPGLMQGSVHGEIGVASVVDSNRVGAAEQRV